jgi:hypothetical protein
VRDKNQEILVRQEVVIFGQPESAGLHFTNDLFAGPFHFGRRAYRQLLLLYAEYAVAIKAKAAAKNSASLAVLRIVNILDPPCELAKDLLCLVFALSE